MSTLDSTHKSSPQRNRPVPPQIARDKSPDRSWDHWGPVPQRVDFRKKQHYLSIPVLCACSWSSVPMRKIVCSGDSKTNPSWKLYFTLFSDFYNSPLHSASSLVSRRKEFGEYEDQTAGPPIRREALCSLQEKQHHWRSESKCTSRNPVLLDLQAVPRILLSPSRAQDRWHLLWHSRLLCRAGLRHSQWHIGRFIRGPSESPESPRNPPSRSDAVHHSIQIDDVELSQSDEPTASEPKGPSSAEQESGYSRSAFSAESKHESESADLGGRTTSQYTNPTTRVGDLGHERH